ncbi:MAG: branched-chain amino acid ABC transporter permease [Chloroflexota bacterium]
MDFFLDLFVNGLLTGTLYALVALGLVLIYKASGVLNFAQGSMVLLAGFIVALLVHFGLPGWAAILVGALAMIGMSFLVERWVLRPLVAQPIVSLIMVTLGLSLFIEGVQTLTSNIWPVYTLDLGIPRAPIELGGMLILPINLIGSVTALLLFGITAYLFMNTQTGRALRAISDDHEAALSVGVSIKQLWVIVWGAAGVIALVAALIWGTRMTVQFSLSLLAFRAFAVVILGGLDSLSGAIIAGLLVGTAENLVAGYVDPIVGGGTKEFFPYLLMLIVLWVRPYGLFGREIIERV